jgi:hypothetical protein
VVRVAHPCVVEDGAEPSAQLLVGVFQWLGGGGEVRMMLDGSIAWFLSFCVFSTGHASGKVKGDRYGADISNRRASPLAGEAVACSYCISKVFIGAGVPDFSTLERKF